MTKEGVPTGRRPGYSALLSRPCLTLKLFFGMALRQMTGFNENRLSLVELA
nr:transposase [Acetobacter conturbans]